MFWPSSRIWKIGDLILEHADELAQLESLDNGKPVAVVRTCRWPPSSGLLASKSVWPG